MPMMRGERGFTLVEVLMASAVLALAVAALTQAVTAGQMHTYAALEQARATQLGQALLEEVLALPYGDRQGDAALGPDAGETGRSSFDHADDFDGFSEAPGTLADRNGTLYPAAYQSFSRSVQGAYGTLSAGPLGDVRGLTVKVTVRGKDGRAWTLTRLICDVNAATASGSTAGSGTTSGDTTTGTDTGGSSTDGSGHSDSDDGDHGNGHGGDHDHDNGHDDDDHDNGHGHDDDHGNGHGHDGDHDNGHGDHDDHGHDNDHGGGHHD